MSDQDGDWKKTIASSPNRAKYENLPCSLLPCPPATHPLIHSSTHPLVRHNRPLIRLIQHFGQRRVSMNGEGEIFD